MEETYNGWTNKATWLVKLWIDNDQSEQESWLEEAKTVNVYQLADKLKDFYEEENPVSGSSVWSDLMSWALAMVNWDEIAKALVEDAKELA